MKKSLFRLIDRVELLICYILCFGFNVMFDYVKTINIDSYLLKSFLKQFYDYRGIIAFLLTFIVVVFHYQMLNRKKVEVYCRILVGDTGWHVTIRYIVDCLVILGIAFGISMVANIILRIELTNNIYLFCLFVIYILISSGMVKRFENI